MKPKLFEKFMLLAIITAVSFTEASAQCHACTDPAPYTGQQVCGLPTPSLSQPSTTCLAASSCSGTTYSYTVSFPSKIKAYYIYITGGNILSRFISADIISQPYTAYACSPAVITNEFGTDNGNVIYNVQLNIRWTASTPKYIEVYGYTGPANTMTASVAYYGCFAIAASGSVPATPATVGLSSPICSTTPKGWLLGNQSSPGATYYTWSGAVSGTYSSVTGPFIAASQTATVCVAAGNACGVSAPRCATLYIPNICGGGFGRNAEVINEITVEEESGFKADVNVYPNPASGILSVYLKKPGRFTVALINTSGHNMLSTIVTGQMKASINISTLPKGVYIAVISENGVVAERKKILIQ